MMILLIVVKVHLALIVVENKCVILGFIVSKINVVQIKHVAQHNIIDIIDAKVCSANMGCNANPDHASIKFAHLSRILVLIHQK